MFTPEDLKNLKIIHHLLKEKGMTISGVKKKMKENPESIDKNMEVISALERIRDMLVDMRDNIG